MQKYIYVLFALISVIKLTSLKIMCHRFNEIRCELLTRFMCNLSGNPVSFNRH